MIRRSIQEKVITVEIYIVQSVNNLPAVQETWVQFLGWEDPLEEETAIHSSILAWRGAWRATVYGVTRVRHNLATKLLT